MDLDKMKDVEKEEEEIEEIIVKTDKESDNSSSMFKLSYLYIMLASAFLSFCFAIVAFMVCKKSMLDKKDKKQQKLVPFIVSTDPRVINKKSPIVKSYQRVPTSTQEFLHSDFHASSSVKESPSQVPLLT